MRFGSCFLAISAAWIVSIEAHTMCTAMFVNGISVGGGTCLRINKTATNTFIPDITSDEMSCGITGLQKVQRTCPIKAGDVVSFRWQHHPGSPISHVITASHNGTCGVYMKQMSSGDPAPDGSFPDKSPAGDGWFKVMYSDKDSNGRWCIDRLRLASTPPGIVSIKIPSDLQTGYYLIRPELVALHQARKGHPQFYVGCAQVYITGGDGTAKPDTVAIPGYVNMSLLAMHFDANSAKAGYFPGFGPPLFQGKDSSPLPPPPSNQTSASSDVSSQSATTITSSSALSTTALSVTKSTFSTIIVPSTTAVTTNAMKFRAASNTGKFDSKIKPRSSSTDPFACPSNTVLEVGNLCLPDVLPWNDTTTAMTNCWASSRKCNETLQICINGANAAVDYHSGHGCYPYSYKCGAINKACSRDVISGPADLGKVVTEPKEKIFGWGITS